jgi:hypothetical protein
LRSCLALGLSAACVLAVPAAASAATLTADRPCYVASLAGGPPVTLSGSGFNPGQAIDIAGPPGVSGGATSDPAGVFSTQLPVPGLGTLAPVARPVTLTATDAANPSDAASATIEVTNLTFATHGLSRLPQAVRTWTISGFVAAAGADPSKPVYGHFRSHAHTYANHRFGIPTGACGTLTARAPAIPVHRVRAGTWLVQLDQDPQYSAATRPAITSRFTVRQRTGR